MRSRSGIILATAVMVALVGFVGGAVAHPNAGASGNCDNEDAGGGGSVGVSRNPDLVNSPDEVISVAEGVALFAQNADPEGENACDGNDPDDSDTDNDDYVEAHASGGGQFPTNEGIQVCYSDGNDDSSPSEDNVNQGAHYDKGHCE